jgi:thiamine-phosphate pyrophosphorylase
MTIDPAGAKGTVGRLHVLTDARDGRDAVAATRAALSAGAPVIQVRAKGLADADLLDFASRTVELCAGYGATCIVNDRVDVALAAGAQGTHLGADDLPVDVVRRIAGPGHFIGGTARDPRRAAALVAAGADYLGVGPAYSTTTKVDLPRPLGPAGIAAVARAVAVPVIAIGGIGVDQVTQILGTGAHGIAVVAAISEAADPAAATLALLRALGPTR